MSLVGVCCCRFPLLLIGLVSCILRECSYGPSRAFWCVMLVVVISDLWCYSFVCHCFFSCFVIAFGRWLEFVVSCLCLVFFVVLVCCRLMSLVDVVVCALLVFFVVSVGVDCCHWLALLLVCCSCR